MDSERLTGILISAYDKAETERKRLAVEFQLKKGEVALKSFNRMIGYDVSGSFLPEEGKAVIHVGDLWIQHARYEGSDDFHIQGTCPKCGEAAWSKACWDAPSLGGQLVNFQPDMDHVKKCPAKVKPLSWRERLRLALRIMREGR